MLVPKDENDGKNVIMEIRGAAGGDEANIFAGDLFRMYSYYAEKNGWKLEVIHSIEGEAGGFSSIECMIKGSNVYIFLDTCHRDLLLMNDVEVNYDEYGKKKNEVS